LPAIRSLDEDSVWSRQGTRTLCLYGFSFDGPVEVHLSARGGHSAKGVFLVESPTVMPMDVQQLEPEVRDEAGVPRPGAQLVEGVTVLSVPLWWPVSLPSGPWFVKVVAAGVEVQDTVHLMPRTGISTRPAANINPFINHHCKEYRPGDDVIIDGSGFEPGQQQGLGIYRDLGASAELVKVLWTMTNEQGTFALQVTVPEDYGGGTHFIVPGRIFLLPGPDSGTGSLQRGDEPCFQVVRP
jgi:hypothetical protein